MKEFFETWKKKCLIFFFFNINFVLTKLVIHLSKISPYLYFDICVCICVLVQKFSRLSFTLYYGNLRSVFENFLVHTYSSRNVCKHVLTIFWWKLWLNIKYAASSVYSSCLIWEKSAVEAGQWYTSWKNVIGIIFKVKKKEDFMLDDKECSGRC